MVEEEVVDGIEEQEEMEAEDMAGAPAVIELELQGALLQYPVHITIINWRKRRREEFSGRSFK